MSSFSTLGRFGLIISALLLWPAQSFGSTASTTFNVQANVLSTCVVSATDLDFGNYSAGGASPDDASSTVDVTCNNGLAYTLALDVGGGSGATMAARRMTSGGDTLNYSLYTTSGHGTVWGDGSASSATIAGTGNGSQQGHTVYGRIPAGQFVPAGSYSDTITVTVTY